MTDEEIKQIEDLDFECARLRSELDSVKKDLQFAEMILAAERVERRRLSDLWYGQAERAMVQMVDVPF